MDRRRFIFSLGVGAASLSTRKWRFFIPERCLRPEKIALKNWVWVANDPKFTEEDWKRKFSQMRESGIQAIFFLSYTGRKALYESRLVVSEGKILETVLPLAKEAGLEVHAWICALICNEETVQKQHTDWFVISRNGDSTLDKQPYIESYRWLCPSRPEVQGFVRSLVEELLEFDDLRGIHLDYIRYPDVILPEALQPKYNLVQDREYPQFDFCYCGICRQEFQKKKGIDLLKIQYPESHAAWRNYRYETVTSLVNSLAETVHRKNKVITAAVFATPELARRYVRQDWPEWYLDSFHPMIYHHYYAKNLDWVGQATREGTEALPPDKPLYSGLFIAEIKPEEMSKAVELALAGGARGITLFAMSAMQDAHWKSLGEFLKNLRP
jgi:uncharacterized lipoprotein YddW (UPF0748 family)